MAQDILLVVFFECRDSIFLFDVQWCFAMGETSPGTGITGSFELPCECWEELLTTELSLQSHYRTF